MPSIVGVVTLAHVALGAAAVIVGALALASRKGQKVHIGAGRLFVIGMGLSSLLGAVLGAVKFETFWITVHAGILGATLVASGVLVARMRAPRPAGVFKAVAIVNFLNAVALFAAGFHATALPDTRLFGFAAADYFFLFGMAAIVSVADMRVVFGAQISNRHRIAQHLLRMCIGFFIAAGSAFTGPGAAAFPEALRDSGLLSLPELIIVLSMLFFLWRTLRRPRNTSAET